MELIYIYREKKFIDIATVQNAIRLLKSLLENKGIVRIFSKCTRGKFTERKTTYKMLRYKKGIKLDCKNYRSISITRIISRDTDVKNG